MTYLVYHNKQNYFSEPMSYTLPVKSFSTDWDVLYLQVTHLIFTKIHPKFFANKYIYSLFTMWVLLLARKYQAFDSSK